MHIEDIYLDESLRGKGSGCEFMLHLDKIAKDRGWSGMEWNALDWNTEAIGFYDKIGAERETGRVYFRKDIYQL